MINLSIPSEMDFIDEQSNYFSVHSSISPNLMLGYQDYTNGAGAGLNKTYVSDFEFTDGHLLLGFRDGHVRKVDIGSYSNSAGILGNEIGVADFNIAVSDITTINNKTFIGLGGKALTLAISKSGGSGYNFAGVDFETDRYVPICGYSYYIGCQNFNDVCASAKLATTDSVPGEGVETEARDSINLIEADEILNSLYSASDNFNVSSWPNPVSDFVNVSIEGSGNGTVDLAVVDILGHTVYSTQTMMNDIAELDLRMLENGIYFIKCVRPDNGSIKIAKILKQ